MHSRLCLLFLLVMIVWTTVVSAEVETLTIDVDRSNELTGEVLVRITLPSEIDAVEIEATVGENQQRKVVTGTPKREGLDWLIPVMPLTPDVDLVEPLQVSVKTTDETLRFETESFEVTVPDLKETDGVTSPTDRKGIVTLAEALLASLPILGVLGALLAFFLYAKRPGGVLSSVEVVEPPIPPMIEARTDLAELQSLSIFRTHGSGVHYERLSMLVRRYIEREHDLLTMEMTEDEVTDLFKRDYSDRRAASEMVALFKRSSAAKFAQAEVSENHVQQDLGTVGAFLDGEDERKRLLELEAERARLEKSSGGGSG